jgi:osmoprotectant transport system permease protein
MLWRIDTPMDERITSAMALLPDYVSQHVLVSAAALALGVAISLPLSVLASRYPRVRWPVLAIASLVQTIPGLALLALFYPLLLGASALTAAAFGFSVPALGFLPSLLALTLYAMLPILRNGTTALLGIDPVYIEAADGVGMTAWQRFFRVEAPLAAPVIMGGIRTAAVWTIGAATLSTTVGQTSLGNYIFSGLQTENWVSVAFGCAAAVVLALVVDQFLGLVEAGAVRRDARRISAGLAGLALGTIAALTPLMGGSTRSYTVGAKNFTEQFILAELMAQQLERESVAVRRKSGLGSAVIFRALASGDIDVYVDYSGTLWTNVMERRDTPPREAMLPDMTQWMLERHGVSVLGPLGFENAYALAMRQDRATALGVKTIADLSPLASRLTLGSDLEFLGRPEWSALKKTYGLDFRAERSFNPTFMYRAVVNGEVDVISAFSSDGRIAADNLLVLADVKHAIPAYDAVILISPKRTSDATIRRALSPLIGAIPVELMREANLMVDRDADKASLQQAVRFLARALKLSDR